MLRRTGIGVVLIAVCGVGVAAGIATATGLDGASSGPGGLRAAAVKPPLICKNVKAKPKASRVRGLSKAEKAAVSIKRICIDDAIGGVQVTLTTAGSFTKVAGKGRLKKLFAGVLIKRDGGAPIGIVIHPAGAAGQGISDPKRITGYIAIATGATLRFGLRGISLQSVKGVTAMLGFTGKGKTRGAGAVAAGASDDDNLLARTLNDATSLGLITSIKLQQAVEEEQWAARKDWRERHPCDYLALRIAQDKELLARYQEAEDRAIAEHRNKARESLGWTIGGLVADLNAARALLPCPKTTTTTTTTATTTPVTTTTTTTTPGGITCPSGSVSIYGGHDVGGNDLHINCLSSNYDEVQVIVSGHTLVSGGINVTSSPPAPVGTCAAIGAEMSCSLSPALHPNSAATNTTSMSFLYPIGDSGLHDSCDLSIAVTVSLEGHDVYTHTFTGPGELVGC